MLELKGADQLVALSAKLKQAGDKDLQRELSKGINKAVKPFREKVRENTSVLPQSGGLAARAAKIAAPRVRKSSNGVRMVATGKKGLQALEALNAGSIRHPVFGRGGWASQSVTPGFWDKAVEEVGPEVTKQIEAAAAEIIRRIGA